MKADGIEVFREIIHDICHVWSWSFDYDLNLLDTNCIAPNLFSKILLHADYMNKLKESGFKDPPLIVTSQMGFMYAAVFGEKEIRVLGPVYTLDLSERDLRRLLKPYKLKDETQDALLDNLKKVPMISSSSLFEKTLMLHELATQETLGFSDLRYHADYVHVARVGTDDPDRGHSPILNEKRLLDAVREGNENYHEVLSEAAMHSHGIRAKTGDPLRQAKYSVVAFITLCSRAAIEGGLPVDTAYTLSDTYTTSLDALKTISEVTALSHTMYEDFITRVHHCRSLSGRSREVRIACDYMDLHPEETITLEFLSERVGYAPYYLSRKIREETGMTPAEYLNKARLREAKILLESSGLSIQEISDRLNYSSRAYFSKLFAKETGMPPARYRAEHLNP